MMTTTSPIDHNGGSVWLDLSEADGTLKSSTASYRTGCVTNASLISETERTSKVSAIVLNVKHARNAAVNVGSAVPEGLTHRPVWRTVQANISLPIPQDSG